MQQAAASRPKGMPREKGHTDHSSIDRGGWAEIFQRERGGVNEEASLSRTVRPSVISTRPDKQATIH